MHGRHAWQFDPFDVAEPSLDVFNPDFAASQSFAVVDVGDLHESIVQLCDAPAATVAVMAACCIYYDDGRKD